VIARVVSLVASVIVLAGCTADGIGGITLVTHGSHHVLAGERIPGSVAVGGGALVIEPGASVGGDLFVGDGSVRIEGSIAGSVSALGGRVDVASSAHVAGGIRVGVSAVVQLAPGARVDGGVEEGLIFPEAEPSRTSPVIEAVWAVARVILIVVLAGLIRRIAPLRARRGAAYLVAMPGASLAYGFLVALVGMSLIVFMAFTLILIPVALLGLLALAVAALLGLAALAEAVSDRLGRMRGHAVIAVGLVVLPVLPLIGFWMTLAIGLAVLGAGVLAIQRPALTVTGAVRPA
jgi:hypothetical protein